MEFEKFTDRSRGFIQEAKNLAIQSNHQQLTPLHLLKVLLRDKQGLISKLIRVAGGEPEKGLRSVETELNKIARVQGKGAKQVYLSQDTETLFEQAKLISEKAGDQYITVEKLLLALTIAKDTVTAKILADAGVSAESLNKAIENLRKGHSANTATVEDTYDALTKYALDLTVAASEGKIQSPG